MSEETQKTEERRPQIFAMRTTVGQEKTVADMMDGRAKNYGFTNLLSILAPPDIRGYVFVEVFGGRHFVERLRSGMKHAKGVVGGEVPLQQLEGFLTPKPAVVRMNIGDLVEIASGPFRGERAKIIRIDESKEEITVELIEATVPIPVTVRGDMVKVIQRAGEVEGSSS
jgi:transcriptional antiterminator NusG